MPSLASLTFPIEASLQMFCNEVKRGQPTREDTERILAGLNAIRALPTAVFELTELFGLVQVVISKNEITDKDVATLCSQATEVKRLADRAFDEHSDERVLAVKISVSAVAVLSVDESPDFVATRLRCQVDKLLSDDKVKRAIRIQEQGGTLMTGNRKKREAFLFDVLAAVSQETAFTERHGIRVPRPLIATVKGIRACLIGEHRLQTLDETQRWSLFLVFSRSLDFTGFKGTSALATALENNSTVTSLCLSNSQLVGHNGASSLADMLVKNSTLTELFLGKNKLGKHGAAKLANGLAKSSRLVQLDLERCDIGDDGVSKLATALANNHNSALASLALGGNNIAVVGVSKLATALVEKPHSTLTSLSLCNNKLGDDGAARLADAMSTLIELDIQENEIGDDGISKLAAALTTGTSTLTSLDLAKNRFGAQGTSHLATALAINSTLASLVLAFNDLGDEDAAILAGALMIDSTLTSLRRCAQDQLGADDAQPWEK